MPLTLPVGKAGQAQLHEWSGPDGSGIELPPVGPVTYASDNPAIATVDPNTGTVVGVAAGTANISGNDAGNGMSASDVVTVAQVTAQSATLSLTALTPSAPLPPAPSPKH